MSKVEITKYPKTIKPNDDIAITLDWTRDWIETWWMPISGGQEVYFKFILDGVEILKTNVFNSGGPGTFYMNTGAVAVGDNKSLVVEMWDEDSIGSDDFLTSDQVYVEVRDPADVPDGGDDFEDTTEAGVAGLLEKYFTWILIGSVIVAIILMVVMGVPLTIGAVLTTLLLVAIAWLIKAFWDNDYAIYVATGICVIAAVLPALYPEAYALMEGVAGTAGGYLPF